MKVLIVGDSQAAGPPGATAERRLRNLGHGVLRIGHPGMGPYDHVRISRLWASYTAALRRDAWNHVLFIFGSNDRAGEHLESALRQLRRATNAVTWLSGPPRYESPQAQLRGVRIRAVYMRAFADGTFIDPYPWTGAGAQRASDGLHFTAAGGARWGLPLAEELVRRSVSQPATR